MSQLPREGEVFGRYRILGRLGRGGMGVVLRALQVDLGREVALKLLPAELADEAEFSARFEREARILASVDSPHIITVYDHGEIDGRLFIATQLVRDGDLGQLLERSGPLPLTDSLDLVAQVAGALADAHDAGVVHRDVKPSNVLLRRIDDGWHAYLCDFGIAQSDATGLTHAGVVVGTFSYLAPERCEGAPATVASDIYALGCLLVAAVTGRAPYAGSDFQVAQQHVSAPVPRWDLDDPAEALNAVVALAMAKRPEDRYASARDLRRDVLVVRRRLEGATTGAAPVPAPEETVLRAPIAAAATGGAAAGGTASGRTTDPAPRRRRRVWWAAAAVALALTLAGGGAAALVAAGHDDPASGTSAASAPLTRTSPTPSTTRSPTATRTPRASQARPSPPVVERTRTVQAQPTPSAFARADLSCESGQYVVVLASVLAPTSPFSAVEQVLTKFDNAPYPPKYALGSASCPNLTHVQDASSAAWVPYLGPFDDAGAACQARIDVADTSTYVARAGEGETSKILCSCALASPDLPALDARTDGTPSREHSFWVLELQSMLRRAGYATEAVAGGHYGPLTTQWVTDLQSAYGLPTTGDVDTDTWDALKGEVCP